MFTYCKIFALNSLISSCGCLDGLAAWYMNTVLDFYSVPVCFPGYIIIMPCIYHKSNIPVGGVILLFHPRSLHDALLWPRLLRWNNFNSLHGCLITCPIKCEVKLFSIFLWIKLINEATSIQLVQRSHCSQHCADNNTTHVNLKSMQII